MKKCLSVAAVMMATFLGLSSVACGGGRGPEDPACMNLPLPIGGKVVKGTFTIAYDKSQCSQQEQCRHFNVHAVLTRGSKVHLYSFATPLGDGDLCGLDSGYLKREYAPEPCNQRVGQDFGIPGVPVIETLTIKKMDFCGDTSKQMIKGDIVIRVVPPSSD